MTEIPKKPELVREPVVPTEAEARDAVRTLLRYIGEDPEREGLKETPDRVTRAFAEFSAGYRTDPAEHLERTFGDVEGYSDLVLVQDIRFVSTCEHHLMPFHGVAHVAYLPVGRVVGLSKICRLVEGYARRLQTQERLTAQVVRSLEERLEPRGVAVMLEASHSCMTLRGIASPRASTLTTQFSGAFKEEPRLERRFLEAVRKGGHGV